jgi:hypothetical protein
MYFGDNKAEVRIGLGRFHIPFTRAVALGKYDKPTQFVLRCDSCNTDIRYEPHKTDADLNEWKCGGCTAPGNVLFTDAQLKTMSLVAMAQRVYVARVFDKTEEILKLDLKNEKLGAYHFTRPMTRDEKMDYNERIINSAVEQFARDAHLR